MLVVEGASPRTLNVTDYGEVVLAERLVIDLPRMQASLDPPKYGIASAANDLALVTELAAEAATGQPAETLR